MFSVIIPLYNKRSYIARAVKSVLAQSCRDFELLIVDNNSNDDSLKELESIIDSRIKVLFETRQGVSFARNKGASEAKFQYLVFLDADDEFLPHHLAELKEMIEAFPDGGAYADSYHIVTRTGRKRERKIIQTQEEGRFFKLVDFPLNYIAADMPVTSYNMACSKAFFQSLGGFPVDLSYGEDTVLFLKMFLNKPVYISQRPGAIYWRNAENRSDVPERLLQELPVIGVLEKIAAKTEDKGLSEGIMAMAAKNLFLVGLSNMLVGKTKEANAFFLDPRMDYYSRPNQLLLLKVISSFPVPIAKFLFSLILKVKQVN
ncbi:MAG: glycosyltransferase family 2 protein [Bacteroidia bacterium]|nr:glycosyltransferase family 2 protein [Bacteroidia bacterium]